MLKVEAGKRYVRRDGSVTPPLMVDPLGWDNIVIDPQTELIYSSQEGDERGPFVFSFREDAYDLMSVYEGED